MNRIIILVSTGVIFTILSCSGNSDADSTTANNTDTTSINTEEVINEPAQISEDVDAAKFKSLIESGNGLLIDVRTPEEYSEGHIAGSVNIDFKGSDFDAALDTLDKSVPIYVYCQAGGRSGQTKDKMLEKGFAEVYNLVGGFGEWPYKD
jgi:rhodanese-related sulfurtransferase